MKKKWIVAIVLGIVITAFFSLVGIVVFQVMDEYREKALSESLFEDAKNFIEYDSDFSDKYTKPVSVTRPAGAIESVDSRIWHVSCIVEVEAGKQYLVTIELNFNLDDNFSYVSVVEQ